MSCEEGFIRQLRARGLRLTPQREMVLGVLHQMAGFASAEEIYERVRVVSAAVDLSTVYRTLDLLQDFQIVACVEGNDGQRRYELATDHAPHIHLVCTTCGAVTGATPDPLLPGLAALAEQSGFAVDLAQLCLPGQCARCRAAAAAQATPRAASPSGSASTGGAGR
jgi:Fur family ferric uptake transcriptional regulator